MKPLYSDAEVQFRPMKEQPEGEPAPLSEWSKGIASACHDHNPDETRLSTHTEQLRGKLFPFRRPNGRLVAYRPPFRPGEKCYRREAWKVDRIGDELVIRYKSDNAMIYVHESHDSDVFALIDLQDDPWRWRSPITMPQWAARRFFFVVSCTPVRVNEVTEEDARASGIIDGGCLNCGEHEPCGCNNPEPSARETFIWEWNQKHPGKEWAWRLAIEPSGITG